MNFTKIYENNNQEQLTSEDLKNNLINLYNSCAATFNTLLVLYCIKVHYITKSSNISNVNNQMINTATGQNASSTNLAEVEQAFNKYLNFASSLVSSLESYNNILIKLNNEHQIGNLNNEISAVKQNILKFKNFLGNIKTAFQSESISQAASKV